VHKAIKITVPILAMTLVAACGSSNGGGSSDSSSGGSSSSSSNSAYLASLDKLLKPTYTKPPTASSPAAKKKTIGIVAVGLSSTTIADGVAQLKLALKDIGWSYKVYDAKLDPSQFPKLTEAAIADKVDGIVGMGLDAPLVKTALADAKAAGIQTVGFEGWDLNEDPGTPGLAPVYTTHINFGNRYKGFADAVRAYGAASAAWSIKKANGSGTIINLYNNEYTTLKLMQQGWMKEIATCKGCKNVNDEWVAADFGPKLTAKAQAAFTKNPDAKAVNGATNPELGITQAVVQSGLPGKVPVIGGFGLAANFDIIRANKGLDATNSWPTKWWAYACIDTLNSAFNGKPLRDEGLGSAIVDKSNLPPAGQGFDPLDVAPKYRASWGVSG
jgi:ribose transport system substrate-binding protein